MPLLKPTEKNIKKAAFILKNGGVVAFPTETVYGLGASAFDEKAVRKVFELKKRPYYDPLIVHISSLKQLKEIAEVDKNTLNFLKKIWPGPLTIILKKKKNIPDIVTASLDTVAIRYPKNKIAIKLIKYTKTPIAAPSANKFSRLSPTKSQHVLKYFPNILVLDGGKTVHGVESTIIKIECNTISILRHGAIPFEEIKKFWKGKIINTNSKKIISPGLLKKHYSPNKKLYIIKKQNEIKDPLSSAFISFGEKPTKKYALFLDLSPKKDIDEAASNLFDYLHIAEENERVKCIYIKYVPQKHKGKAIMERLRKACGL